LGSWRDRDVETWGLCEAHATFRQACRKIGYELVKRGHTLIVGSDSDSTADCHAVKGALQALDESSKSPRILVIRPESKKRFYAFEGPRRNLPGVFVEQPVAEASWTVAKIVQTTLADAVILIGGAVKTEQAGLIAAVSKKPLACIGSFGGAARKLNGRFYQSPTDWGYDANDRERLQRLQEPYSEKVFEDVLKTALELAWIEGAPKVLIVHGRSADRDTLKSYLQNELKVGRVIVLADEFSPTQPIPLKFERLASSVDGAIALLTPDDAGSLASSPGDVRPRARENVWIEVGWFWGRRGRAKLLLLKKGDVMIPSDLGNVEHYEYTDAPSERDEEIRQFIERLRSPREAASY
jgi:hypothetical protein